MIKRGFDLVMAVAGLLVAAPLLAVAAVAIRLESAGPVLFSQERVGRNFRPFRIYKLRTMTARQSGRALLITARGDPRVTFVGRFLRKSKIDEVPQLFNVLIGDMSLVGPRPEVSTYVEMFREDYREILTVRPGITDIASIEYRDEETLLSAASDPEQEYAERILPAKIEMAKEYVRRSSFIFDLRLIVKTLLKVVFPA
jgi:lipopolysaccharide/colanic/teichoic acid biosynthesis glycosyltransferase